MLWTMLPGVVESLITRGTVLITQVADHMPLPLGAALMHGCPTLGHQQPSLATVSRTIQ